MSVFACRILSWVLLVGWTDVAVVNRKQSEVWMRVRVIPA